ncbi:MAG: replicative DNA helicase [Clostridiales bacterium]|jgi:replicative DNA helicase|nr:replicative DNA helicase [Clostridiales bacterium]
MDDDYSLGEFTLDSRLNPRESDPANSFPEAPPEIYAPEVPARRAPQQDPDAESAVLASMLFDKDALLDGYELLTADDFYRPDYRAVFSAMSELVASNRPVDAFTLKNKLEELGSLDEAGGPDAIIRLTESVATSVNIRHYAKIVADKSSYRRIAKAGADVESKALDGAMPVDALLEFAERSIFDVAQKRRSSEFSHVRDVLVSAIERIEAVYLSGGHITGVETGFADFDIKTSGLQPSDLILIAARPSMGKTAFALNIAQNVAVRGGKSVAVFSLEMSKEQLVNRMICSQGLIDSQKLRTGKIEPDDWITIARAAGMIADSSLFIDDTPGISAAEIRSKCRRLKLEKGLDLVVIDYLQLMSGKGDSRQQEISEVSRSLKAIARELNAPVVALSQLSRAPEARGDHRPQLSDLRESGAIEQDADVVAFLFRDEYYNPETTKKNMAEVIIAKQRNGPTGSIDLVWMGQYTKFENMAH